MAISQQEVRHMARLARLALTDDEVAQLARQLGGILEYIEQLSAVDVGGVLGTSHAVSLDGPLRADEVHVADVRDAVLAAAPHVEEGLFVVPKIVDV